MNFMAGENDFFPICLSGPRTKEFPPDLRPGKDDEGSPRGRCGSGSRHLFPSRPVLLSQLPFDKLNNKWAACESQVESPDDLMLELQQVRLWQTLHTSQTEQLPSVFLFTWGPSLLWSWQTLHSSLSSSSCFLLCFNSRLIPVKWFILYSICCKKKCVHDFILSNVWL